MLKQALLFACSLEFWRAGLFWTISLLFSYLQLHKSRIFGRRSSAASHCVHSLNDSMKPVCVITGVTSGLGKAAAFALSREGFYVVLVGRSSDLLSKIVNEIKNQNKDAHLKAFEADMSSFQSILKFRDSLQQWLLASDLHCSIQLLVNNAGILASSGRLSSEGYDETLATNYIGAFSLTKLLFPLLRNSPVPSRVVNVTSFTHRSVFSASFDKDAVTGMYFLRSKQYPFGQTYEYSKLCLLLFSYELHRQLLVADDSNHVSVIAADPGLAKTNLLREVPSYLISTAFFILKLLGLLQCPEDAVESIIDAALAPPEISGQYFFGGKGRTIESSALSRDPKLAKQLWDTSCDLFNESLSSNDRGQALED